MITYFQIVDIANNSGGIGDLVLLIGCGFVAGIVTLPHFSLVASFWYEPHNRSSMSDAKLDMKVSKYLTSSFVHVRAACVFASRLNEPNLLQEIAKMSQLTTAEFALAIAVHTTQYTACTYQHSAGIRSFFVVPIDF